MMLSTWFMLRASPPGRAEGARKQRALSVVPEAPTAESTADERGARSEPQPQPAPRRVACVSAGAGSSTASASRAFSLPFRQRGGLLAPALPASLSARSDRSCHSSASASPTATVTPAIATPATPANHAPISAAATSSLFSYSSVFAKLRRRRRYLTANESLLDVSTASLDANMAERHTTRNPRRDSHEISLSSRDVTRDSLVVNMLLSLDQFSFNQPSSPSSFEGHRGPGAPTATIARYDNEDDLFDDEDYDDYANAQLSRTHNTESTTNSRTHYDSGRQHHWLQSSYNSDSEDVGNVHESGKQKSAALPPSRGRRSNSGSSRLPTSQFPQRNNKRDMSHRAQAHDQTPPPRDRHTRGGMHSSKSSSSASIDMGVSNASNHQRLGPKPARSASFDHEPPPSRLQQLQQLSLSASCQANFPGNSIDDGDDDDDDDDEYAAAPTPNVPSGPRREASGLHLAHSLQPPQPVGCHRLERRRSTSRSIKSSAGKSKKGAAAQSTWEMPFEELDSAPAPSVSYGKSKEPEVVVHTSTPAKERPGFFRRVFGASSFNKNSSPASSNNNGSSQTGDAQLLAAVSRTAHAEHQQAAPSSRDVAAVPPRDMTSSHPHRPPPLQKKSSSFFRRRKKSLVDDVPSVPATAEQIPPMPSWHSLAHHPQAKDETLAAASNTVSPSSSLRQVMSPFLRESSTGVGLTAMALSTPVSEGKTLPRTKSETHVEAEYKRDFSPDYDPSPHARIRRVQPEADTPSRPSKQTQKTLRHSNSFLDLDAASDNEDAADGRCKEGPKSHNLLSASASASASVLVSVSVSPAASRSENDGGDRDATIRGKKNLLKQLVEDNRPSAQSMLGAHVDGAGRSTSFASASTEAGYQTAPSAAASVLADAADTPSPLASSPLDTTASYKPLDEPEYVLGEPTEDDRLKAQKIYDGGEDFIQKDKAAAWMGEQGPIRQRTLQAYMELYNFRDQSILGSLRRMCERLVLKAETQQVDRILVAFSKRWCDCNPQHGFKATDVIHTICYSIMLLNTDLHVANIEQKMTRSQFIKNTMTTIKQAVAESTPSALAFVRPSILPDKNPMLAADSSSRSHRNSFRPPPRSDAHSSDREDDCGPLVKVSFHGTAKAWEEQVETVLKSIYTSIREERLPLFGGVENEKSLHPGPSQSSLSVFGAMKRSPSVSSKTPSESQLSSRGRPIIDTASRTSASRWTSKSRSRPGFGRTGLSSSRTSFDEGHSMWSPALSSATWSKHSLGRTQASMSQDSFASSMPRGDYQQSIGFANALSQAIIRDEDAQGLETAPSIMSADISSTQFLEDESLELAGPPWIKEGMVMHKHHLDGCGRRAKDRNWAEVFAVVQKGQISLFSFNASKSTRQKSRSRNVGRPTGPVGGGNWQDNAVNLGTFTLRLTLASALPSPGYSRSRPHVWALSLPTGAVHLFQVGTPEIIREFVHTANYWSARLSSHPLVGGISNIEYGWSDAIVNNALVGAINESTTSLSLNPGGGGGGGGVGSGRSSRPGSSAATHGRKNSTASGNIRASSFDHVSGAFTHNSGRGKLPGDRLHVAEWTPPTQSMRPSNASEAEQLNILIAYVKSIEKELQVHNRLRSPMLLAFTPRGQNATKAMGNWERRSAYLLREIVKFRTYVDCLQQAEARKKEIYREREVVQRGMEGRAGGEEEEEDGDETLRP
ncbi:hypothetical protein E4U09_004227 [Claviceps aff. purpurea]|uniref:SEC7 domain-containing protein n=1 Tax=Claviceps aff. purpurea TaxID=1967640 RepID=A0A9P7QEC7_9HYPO|nr:hypothetical protein E4U09_004227 [Claviceps aff. purpurea]